MSSFVILPDGRCWAMRWPIVDAILRHVASALPRTDQGEQLATWLREQQCEVQGTEYMGCSIDSRELHPDYRELFLQGILDSFSSAFARGGPSDEYYGTMEGWRFWMRWFAVLVTLVQSFRQGHPPLSYMPRALGLIEPTGKKRGPGWPGEVRTTLWRGEARDTLTVLRRGDDRYELLEHPYHRYGGATVGSIVRASAVEDGTLDVREVLESGSRNTLVFADPFQGTPYGESPERVDQFNRFVAEIESAECEWQLTLDYDYKGTVLHISAPAQAPAETIRRTAQEQLGPIRELKWPPRRWWPFGR